MNQYVPTEYNLFLLFSLQYQYVLLFINTKKLGTGTRYFRTHFLLCLKQPTSDPYHFLKVVCEKKKKIQILTIDSNLKSTNQKIWFFEKHIENFKYTFENLKELRKC